MILTLLNGDLVCAPEEVTTTEEAKHFLIKLEIFPNDPQNIHIVGNEPKIMAFYVRPRIRIDEYVINQFPFDMCTWMCTCENESILRYLTSSNRFLLMYPPLWANPHPLCVAQILELFPKVFETDEVYVVHTDLIWNHVSCNADGQVVDMLLSRWTHRLSPRTIITNRICRTKNPQMTEWCVDAFRDGRYDKLFGTAELYHQLFEHASTRSSIEFLWEKLREFTSFSSVCYNPHALDLFRRDMDEFQIYKKVRYETLSDEEFALECVEKWFGEPDKTTFELTRMLNQWMSIKLDKVMVRVVEELERNPQLVDLIQSGHLSQQTTPCGFQYVHSVMMARTTMTTAQQTLHLLMRNSNQEAVEKCKQVLLEQGSTIFEAMETFGLKLNYRDASTILTRMVPELAHFLLAQPGFMEGVRASPNRNKWLWSLLNALSKTNNIDVEFV